MKLAFAQNCRQAHRLRLLSLSVLLTTFGVMQIAHADNTASFSVLHTFSTAEGVAPSGPLTQGLDGRFYGNTAQGGSNNLGTVFAVTSAGVLTVLHTFSGTDGTGPVGPLVAGVGGTLYGVTEYGGSNDAGTVFSISIAGQFTLLHSFAAWANSANLDGMEPRGGLTLGGDGYFYGATTRGGSNDGGTLFRITPAGVLTTLYSFNAFNSTKTDGALPATTLVIGQDGRFYGTTAVGGTNSNGGLAPGTLYALGLDGTFVPLHSFSSTIDGSSPSGLSSSSDGSFYGATSAGGINGSGTLFKTTAQGVITTLYNFSTATTANASGLQSNTEGAFPVSGVLAGNDGTLYGGTVFGGSNGTGGLFSLAPDNTFTVLYQFSNLSNGINSDGAEVICAPMRASDGNLYGVTALGGSNGGGVIYKLTMPALPIVTLTLGASPITSGSSTSLGWSSSGASTCSATGGWSGNQATSGSVSVSPAVTTTYTLNCRNLSGTTTTSTTLTIGANSGTGTGTSSNTNTGSANSSKGGAMPLWLIAWGVIALFRNRKLPSLKNKT